MLKKRLFFFNVFDFKRVMFIDFNESFDESNVNFKNKLVGCFFGNMVLFVTFILIIYKIPYFVDYLVIILKPQTIKL